MSRGEVWAVDIPSPSGRPGHEQRGKRPGIVVQADIADSKLPTTIIIPATANPDAQRFPFTMLIQPSPLNGLDRPSVLLVFQIRAIDKSRLNRKLGRLEDDHIKKLDDKIRGLLQI